MLSSNYATLRWCHTVSKLIYEYMHSAAPSGICWHAKDFPMSSEVDAEVGETQPGFIRWLAMHSRMSQWFYNVLRCCVGRVWDLLNRVSICSQLQHSMMPALSNAEQRTGDYQGIFGVVYRLYCLPRLSAYICRYIYIYLYIYLYLYMMHY